MKRFLNTRTLLLFAILLFLGPVSVFAEGGLAAVLDWFLGILIAIPGVIVALAFHEFAHAWVAYKCGDPTPKVLGRVTLDPTAHVDLLGILMLIFCGFGWGKPVVINPSNFKKKRRDSIMVGLAGVTMNLIVAVVFGGILKGLLTAIPGLLTTEFGITVFTVFYYVVQINAVLMLFNLLPVPPLDGFGVISDIFNLQGTKLYNFVYRNGLLILLVLVIFNVPAKVISLPSAKIVNFIVRNIWHVF